MASCRTRLCNVRVSGSQTKVRDSGTVNPASEIVAYRRPKEEMAGSDGLGACKRMRLSGLRCVF